MQRTKTFGKSAPKNRTNEAIRVSPIRLIGEDGEQIGVIETEKALQMARDLELDLVEISPNAKPPVCKIIGWGKFQYLQAKKENDSKKKQKKTEVKGVRIRPSTGENDLNFKRGQAEKFLKKGNKVKIQIVLRGREKAFSDLAKQTLRDFIDKIEIPVKIEQDITKQFNGFSVLIAPNE